MENNNQSILKKYEINAPRYTSYPPFPFWQNNLSPDLWSSSLQKNYQKETGLDIYIHIPFCDTLCYFCGCNKIITKNKNRGDEYVEYLYKEWSAYEKLLDRPQINSIHLGGGTPTFLSPKTLDELLGFITKHQTKKYLGSIEIDPRDFDVHHLDILKKHGFERISFGIQDFDPKVQQSVNRIQSLELVTYLVKEIRKRDFASLNFDLIYGLPNQTIQSNLETMQKVLALSPDVIAYYLYAHLPSKIKNQNLIKEAELPNAETKYAIFNQAKKLFLDFGYEIIGLDHFGKKNSFLTKAQKEKKLYRNFMGYVDKKSNILLGLGISSISSNPDYFIQKGKTLKEYYDQIENNPFSYHTGHALTEMDKNVDEIIQKIMCQEEVNLNDFEFPHRDEVLKELNELQDDGLIEMSHLQLKVTKLGKNYLRIIAKTFDFHLRQQKEQVRFSKTL